MIIVFDAHRLLCQAFEQDWNAKGRTTVKRSCLFNIRGDFAAAAHCGNNFSRRVGTQCPRGLQLQPLRNRVYLSPAWALRAHPTN